MDSLNPCSEDQKTQIKNRQSKEQVKILKILFRSL